MSAGAFDGLEAQAEAIETRMGSHVEEIMAAARKASAQLQAEVERASAERAGKVETAAARRAHAVRMAAEAEAERLHVQTRTATQQYVTASRRLVDEFAKERMHRIAEIADRLAEQADALVQRLMRSDEVARQLNELRVALGVACELIAVEAGRDSPALPEISRPDALVGPPPTAADAAPVAIEEIDVGAAQTLEQRLARATGRFQLRAAAPDDTLPDTPTPGAGR